MEGLKERAILITGSSRGIGAAIARRLAEAGCTVGVHGRDLEAVTALAGELGQNAVALTADLSEPDAAADLVARFFDETGRIDGLVNNAGGGRARPFRGVDLEAWRSTQAVNAEAALRASQAAYDRMRKQRSGAIVNITSISAHGPGKWMGADYAASKAALVSLTKSLAFEAARFGVRCNAVSPGFVETDMTAELSQEVRKP